jgi:hypothetical protein
MNELLSNVRVQTYNEISIRANYQGDHTELVLQRVLDPHSMHQLKRFTKKMYFENRSKLISEFNIGNLLKHINKKTIDTRKYASLLTLILNLKHTATALELQTIDKILIKRARDKVKLLKSRVQNARDFLTSFRVNYDFVTSDNCSPFGGGALYNDSFFISADPQKVTDLQINITKAHEVGHVIRTSHFQAAEEAYFRKVFSTTLNIFSFTDKLYIKTTFEPKFSSDKGDYLCFLLSKDYLEKPVEILERLAQIKNYFGLKAGETVTREHILYAKNYYVTDTGMDNNMTEFLFMLDVDRVVEIMNEYPV